MPMKIYVDADGCPRAVRDIVTRAGERRQVSTTLVANRHIHLPRSRFLTAVQVSSGMDIADHWIAARVEPGDLVITADVPLAAEVVETGAIALDPRGHLYDAETVRERLSVRDFMTEMRAAGLTGGGPPPFGEVEKRKFAAAFDRILTRALRTR